MTSDIDALNLILCYDSGVEFLSDKWNCKVDQIMNSAVADKSYESLSEISSKPERLKKDIINELAMEGYEHPKSKVLYSILINEELIKTIVAISDNDFDGPAMLFHMIFKDGVFAGLGVDFGMPTIPSFKALPVSENQLIGYDFNSDVTIELEVLKFAGDKINHLSINN